MLPRTSIQYAVFLNEDGKVTKTYKLQGSFRAPSTSLTLLVAKCYLANVTLLKEKDFGSSDFHADSLAFFKNFDFYHGDLDPTHGVVDYVDEQTALNKGLIKNRNGQTYISVDSKTVLQGNSNRSAVRLESHDRFTHGLFILDVAHMPGGICGTWPAWWLFGDVSPNSTLGSPTGEIDIIEGANSATTNQATLYAYRNGSCFTYPSNSSQQPDMYGHLQGSNSNNCSGDATGAGGCEIADSRADSFGKGFNAEGGGVYALEWTTAGMRVFFLSRAEVRSRASGKGGPLSSSPDPATWGKPTAVFGGSLCRWDSFFNKLIMIFNTTFCGDDGGGDAWKGDDTCSALAPTCEEFVRKNPRAFENAYWLINSVKVYKQT
ncbi:hypothetical protein G7Y89_g10829 [Cudoniella acicularis]|uniref:GH16 domain-containing protein n=1 Tax=Cudoniella acicularis TaxID=354080 RepID=A0A8H4REB8_9HELO|nr:hypothetical protein G7Y89_g10829 [Cudoniella acicularis]